MRKTRFMEIGLMVLALAGLGGAPRAMAADHMDGFAVKTDPSSDITDIFAWTSSDGTKVNLVMNVFPLAATGSKFSNALKYVFHVSSCASYATAGCTAARVNIICTFDASSPQKVSCWVGTDEYVTGDASAVTGLSSGDGKLKIFTGLRDDPFFFNLDGFKKAAADVVAAKSGFLLDAAGCPMVNPTTSTALLNDLSQDPNNPGNPGKDFFAKLNVLSIVLQVDKSLLTKGGPIVGVWASTNK
jgi:hypothetical protein